MFEFFWFWLCSMSFLCFLCFCFSLFFGCASLLAYCFALLASLAFRSFAFHCCFIFGKLLLLWLLLVFLLHFLVYLCLALLVVLTCFLCFLCFCSLFILVGCFFVVIWREMVFLLVVAVVFIFVIFLFCLGSCGFSLFLCLFAGFEVCARTDLFDKKRFGPKTGVP